MSDLDYRTELSHQQRRTIDVLEHLVDLDLGRMYFAADPVVGEPVTLTVRDTSSSWNDETGGFQIVVGHHGEVLAPTRNERGPDA